MSSASFTAPQATITVEVHLLLAVLGRYISCHVPCASLPSAPRTLNSFTSQPPLLAGISGAEGGSPAPQDLESRASFTQQSSHVESVCVSDVTSFLQAIILAEGLQASLSTVTGETDRVTDAGPHLSIYSAIQGGLLPHEAMVSATSSLILFCDPICTETTLAELFNAHAQAPGTAGYLSHAVQDEQTCIVENLRSSLRATHAVAQGTLAELASLSRTVDAGIVEAELNLAALQARVIRIRELERVRHEGKKSSALVALRKQLAAALTVGEGRLKEAQGQRNAAHTVLRSQEGLNTLASSAAPPQGNAGGCLSDAGPVLEGVAPAEEECFLRGCVTSALGVLQPALTEATRATGLLGDARLALRVVNHLHTRYQESDRRPAVSAHALDLVHRFSLLKRATQVVLAPLQRVQQELQRESAALATSPDFALLTSDERRQLRASLTPPGAESVRWPRDADSGGVAGPDSGVADGGSPTRPLMSSPCFAAAVACASGSNGTPRLVTPGRPPPSTRSPPAISDHEVEELLASVGIHLRAPPTPAEKLLAPPEL